MNQQQSKQISLDVLLEKSAKLHRLLESAWDKKISSETRENIRWYCGWRLEQYYGQYQSFLADEKEVDLRYNKPTKIKENYERGHFQRGRIKHHHHQRRRGLASKRITSK